MRFLVNASMCLLRCVHVPPVVAASHRRLLSTVAAVTVTDRVGSPPTSTAPLAGIRILDLSRILAAPYCSQVLSDYGADIIKVEHPAAGDDTRGWGPPFTSRAKMSAYFMSVNRGKRSVCINLKHDSGKQLIRRLAQHCDVIIENFPPTKMDELGLGYSALSSLNPRLIFASLSAYGTRGPLSAAAGYDVMVAAQGGLMYVTGEAAQPAKPGVALTDITSGLYLHGAILAALLQRHSTGRGQHVRTSLYQCQTAAMSMVMQNQLLEPTWQARRWGTAHPSIVPYQSFRCSDSAWIVAGALSDSQWRVMQRLLELPSTDGRFDSNAGRVKHRDELIDRLTAIIASQPSQHWLAVLTAHRLPCAPVLSPAAVIDSEQVEALGLRVTVEQAVDGRVEMVAPPVEMSEAEVTVRSGAPLLGQHTAEVLREMCGVSEQELQQLEQQGTVRQWRDTTESVDETMSTAHG